jgi:hypothetical protein
VGASDQLTQLSVLGLVGCKRCCYGIHVYLEVWGLRGGRGIKVVFHCFNFVHGSTQCVMGQVELGESSRGRASVDVRKQGLQQLFYKQHERLQGSDLGNRSGA